MRKSCEWLVQLASLGLALVVSTASFAKDEPGDELVQMIVKLLSDSDKDLRAVGLDQIRTAAKGANATRQFAAQLPRLSAAAQAALLSALADRGDAAALPAVNELLGSNRDGSVRVAAVRAIGSLGGEPELPILLKSLSAESAGEKSAARSALRRMRGETVSAAMANAMKDASPHVHIALIEILTSRRALDTVGSILADAKKEDNAEVRKAAMTSLGQLASAGQVPGMLEAVLKAQKGPERAAAEKSVALVCSRNEDPEQSAVVAAWSKFKPEEQVALLTTLGRVGGTNVYPIVKEAMKSDDAQRREAGFMAIANWPDAMVLDELFSLAQEASASQRAMLFNAFVRVGSQRDGRTDLQRLERMKQAMSIAKTNEERTLAINRARTSYAVESLRFVMPYLDRPEFVQVACETIVELAHHREVREPNKVEFDSALDKVIKLSGDEVVVERANRYKKGETWERPKPPEGANAE